MTSVLNFSRNATDDVLIDKMQLIGDIDFKQQILLAIETQLCAQFDNTNIVIIKKLDVADTRQTIAEKITSQAMQLKASAVSGLSVQAQSAAAVYFTNSFELELALITDLLNGHKAWYWQSWNIAHLDKRQAIKHCLLQSILQLPKLLQALVARHLAHEVLNCLGRNDLKELTQAIYAQTQWSIFTTDGLTTKNFSYKKLSHNHAVNSVPIAQLKSYQELLNNNADKHLSDSHNGELCHLLIILLAWQYNPQIMLNTQHQHRWFEQLFNYFYRDNAIPRITTKPAENQDKAELPNLIDATVEAVDTDHNIASTEVMQSTNNSAVKNGQAIYELSAKVAIKTENTLPKLSDNKPLLERPKRASKNEEQGFTTDYELANKSYLPTQLDTSSRAEDVQFYTQSAGFYFLINILKQEEYQAIIIEQQLNPWHILYRLSRGIKLPLDSALQVFLANKLQLVKVEELATVSHFSQEPLWLNTLSKTCNTSLATLGNALQIYGKALTSTGYLDVYFHHSAIDINIRIAGLDINPTWLPWLGLVVNFHYIDDDHLLADDAYKGKNNA